MPGQTINEISVTPVPVHYRKELGRNSRGENMGRERTEWLVRARTDGGLEGLTIANRFMREFTGFNDPEGTVRGLMALLRESLLGKRVDEFLEVSGGRVVGVTDAHKPPFWEHGWMSILAFDLLGRDMGVSCVDLLGGRVRDVVPAYDTTLYYQDLVNPEKGAGQVAEEAAESRRDGYRQFKMKVGRPGRWMAPQAGLERDIEVVLAVREAVGSDAAIMVDANFGYDGRLDLLEDFVRETLSANIFWMEEMVTHNVADYRVFRRMKDRLGSNALLVCGEVDRDPPGPVFVDLVNNGLIDGYQPDTVSAGFSRWQALEKWLEPTSVRSIPHNFGNSNFGARATLVFGAASKTFESLEDERYLPNVYANDDVTFEEGSYSIPAGPGLGLAVDQEIFAAKFGGNEVIIK